MSHLRFGFLRSDGCDILRSVPHNAVRAEGVIRNTNTLDAFKQVDKTEMIQNAARQVRKPCGGIYGQPCSGKLTRNVADLGRDQGRHHLLGPVTSLSLHYPLICRPQKVPHDVLVWFPDTTFRSTMEAHRRYPPTQPERKHSPGRSSRNMAIHGRQQRAWLLPGQEGAEHRARGPPVLYGHPH